MERMNIKKVVTLLLLILLLSSICNFVEISDASSHPRNWAEAWNAGFRGIIEPENPTVLQQLHNLCPVIDEEHFTVNFLAVYTYSKLVAYAYDSDVYGVDDYWQTAEETIILGHGDCEDQAIILATLVEALYSETYGSIPSNLVWVTCGYAVAMGGGGGHAWVLINEGCLPKETVEEIKSDSISDLLIDVLLGGIAFAADLVAIVEAKLDLAALQLKNQQQSFSLIYSGERYFELEPTWNLPVSQFYFKEYPYTEVYVIFNSQGYDPSPDFYSAQQPPYMGAEIKNIAFPMRVIVGNTCTVNVTVQNYDCGILGADLVVVLRDYDVEVARQSAYVFKYWWQIQTFVFTLQAIEPAQIEQMTAELYWDYWGTWYLRDFKNFTIETIPNKPDLISFISFTYPRNVCEGELVIFNILGQNLGPAPALSWAVDILIDGQRLDTIWVPTCNGFSGFQIQSRPWAASAGTHSIRVRIDSTDAVSERNETNNELVFAIEVVTRRGSHVFAQVNSSLDDVQIWNNTVGDGWQWNLTYDMNIAGCPYFLNGEDNFGCGLRFANILIPQGAKINYARLELCSAWDDESPVKTKICGQDTGDTLPFSTLAEFNSRAWTSSIVYWDDIPPWKTDQWYFSPDISIIIKEVVDRLDWKSGNSMAILWEDFESRSISYIENCRRAWSYDKNSTLAPRLLIDFEDVTPPQVTVISPENRIYQDSVLLSVKTDEPAMMSYSLDGQANTTFSSTYPCFRFRKNHSINSAIGAGADYQIKITVWRTTGVDSGENVYVGTKCRVDFGDIRFTGSDGVTFLDYWLATCDQLRAVFWVKIPDDLSSSSATIFVYYGNPAVATTSDFDKTFIFGEPFDNPILNTNRWIDVTGNPVYTIDPANHYLEVTDMDSYHWQDGSGFHSKALTLPSSWIIQDAYNDEGFRFYHTSDTNYNIYGQRFCLLNYTGYVASIGLHDAWSQDAHISEYAYVGNDFWASGEQNVSIPYSTSWTIKKPQNGNISLSQNGVDRIERWNGDAIEGILWEISSFQSYGFGTERLFAFVARKFVNPEPTHGQWGNEESEASLMHATYLNNLTDGQHSVIVYACDATGNAGSSPVIYFSYGLTVLNLNVTKGGTTYPIQLVSNATLLNFQESPGSIRITALGDTGTAAYIQIVQPIGLNSTDIKVFLNKTKLHFPSLEPLRSISTNGTHYSVYFEFTFNSSYDIIFAFPIAGDVNYDGYVDIFDCVSVALAFSSTPISPSWNVHCDLCEDGIIDIFDIATVALHFGETG